MKVVPFLFSMMISTVSGSFAVTSWAVEGKTFCATVSLQRKGVMRDSTSGMLKPHTQEQIALGATVRKWI